MGAIYVNGQATAASGGSGYDSQPTAGSGSELVEAINEGEEFDRIYVPYSSSEYEIEETLTPKKGQNIEFAKGVRLKNTVSSHIFSGNFDADAYKSLTFDTNAAAGEVKFTESLPSDITDTDVSEWRLLMGFRGIYIPTEWNYDSDDTQILVDRDFREPNEILRCILFRDGYADRVTLHGNPTLVQDSSVPGDLFRPGVLWDMRNLHLDVELNNAIATATVWLVRLDKGCGDIGLGSVSYGGGSMSMNSSSIRSISLVYLTDLAKIGRVDISNVSFYTKGSGDNTGFCVRADSSKYMEIGRLLVCDSLSAKDGGSGAAVIQGINITNANRPVCQGVVRSLSGTNAAAVVSSGATNTNQFDIDT